MISTVAVGNWDCGEKGLVFLDSMRVWSSARELGGMVDIVLLCVVD